MRTPRRGIPLVLLVLAAAAACREPAPPPPEPKRPVPISPSPSTSVVINPPGVVVSNEAFGRSAKRVELAIRDLKSIDAWYPLTRHLYKIKFGSRLGVVNIPEDGHLADALLTAAFDEKAQGRVCDVRFYPNAFAQDLDRWHAYWDAGAIDQPPPTMRQFWGAIMAHELGHCLPGGPGEKVAEEWEAKALRKLRELSL